MIPNKEAPAALHEKHPLLRTDIFKRHFPSAEIEIINADRVPRVVADFFESKSRSLTDTRDHQPENFNVFLFIRHDSGEVTYAAQQTKTYRPESTEALIYLFDADQFGNRQGDGEIRYSISNNSAFFKKKPFTGCTGTEENFRKRGLDLRRFLMMNALSQMLYGLPLHSDTIISAQAKNIFEQLLKEAKVDKYQEEGRDRYVFVDVIGESIKLLENSGYWWLLKQKETEGRYEMDFFRSTLANSYYPRFHMTLVIPVRTSKLEIASFHMDRSQHKTHTNFQKKDSETTRIIEQLKKEKEGAVRNKLLDLFATELIFGNIREMESLGARTADQRLKKLLTGGNWYRQFSKLTRRALREKRGREDDYSED